MQDNNFKSSQHPSTHYWCKRTKFNWGTTSQHRDMGSFQISRFPACSWEGHLNFNPPISSWDPQDLCLWVLHHEGMGVSGMTSSLLQQLHFWAHWGGSAQLSPCPPLSKSPQTLPCLPCGPARSPWAPKFGSTWSTVEAAAFLQNAAGWKMLNALQQAPRSGLQGSVLPFVGEDPNCRCSPHKGCVTEGRVGSASPAELVPRCGKVKCSVSHGKWAGFPRKAVGAGGWRLLFQPKFVYAFCMKQILHKILMQSLWPGPNPLFQASTWAPNCKAKNHSLAFQCNETFFTSSRALQQGKTASLLRARHLSASYEPGLVRQKRTLNPIFLISQECSTTDWFIKRVCSSRQSMLKKRSELCLCHQRRGSRWRLRDVKPAWREASLHSAE